MSTDNLTISVAKGDGIGPEITAATLRVLAEVDCDLVYDEQLAGINALDAGESLLPEQTLESINRNKIALKGPLTTPIGEGFTSINVQLRKQFDLYANVRPAITRPGVKSRYKNIDIITIRENTEGMYHGERQEVSADGSRFAGHASLALSYPFHCLAINLGVVVAVALPVPAPGAPIVGRRSVERKSPALSQYLLY